jgi:hypothetical protein
LYKSLYFLRIPLHFFLPLRAALFARPLPL